MEEQDLVKGIKVKILTVDGSDLNEGFIGQTGIVSDNFDKCKYPYITINNNRYCLRHDQLELVDKPTVGEVTVGDLGAKINTMDGGGKRFNTGKTRVDLLVPEAMLAEAKVWEFGARKYSPNQWKKGLKVMGILACLLRHTFKIMKGEDIDEESGCLHAAHIKANASMLIYFYEKGDYKTLDDRGEIK